MITTEIDGVVRCDHCNKTRDAVTLPVSISAEGGIGVIVSQIVLPEGWKRIETRFYRKQIVCGGCTEKLDAQPNLS